MFIAYSSFDGSSLRDEKWRFGHETGYPVYSHRYAFQDSRDSPFRVVDAKSDNDGKRSKSYILNEGIDKLLAERVHEPRALRSKIPNEIHGLERRRPHRPNKTETVSPVTTASTTTTTVPYSPSTIQPEVSSSNPTSVAPQAPGLDPNVYQGIVGSLQNGYFPSYYPHIISSPQGEQYGVWSFQGFGQQSPTQGTYQQNFYPHSQPPAEMPQYGLPSINPVASNSDKHPNHVAPITPSPDPPNYFGTTPKPDSAVGPYRPNNGPAVIQTISSYNPSASTLPPPISTDRPNYFVSPPAPPPNTQPPYGVHANHHSQPASSSNTQPTAYPATAPPQRPGYYGQTQHRPGLISSDNTNRPTYYGTSTSAPSTTTPPTTYPPHHYGTPPATISSVPTTDRPNYFGTSTPSTTASQYFGPSAKPPAPPSSGIFSLPSNSSHLIYNPIYIHAPASGQFNINYGPNIIAYPPQASGPSTRSPTTTVISTTTTTTQSTIYWPSSSTTANPTRTSKKPKDPTNDFDIRQFDKKPELTGNPHNINL